MEVTINLLDTHELMQLPPPRWLIKGVLPEGEYSVVWGPSRQGKSFLCLDWAFCLATGTPWQGTYVTQQTPVIYIAAEGGRGIQKRIRALMQHHQVNDIPGLYYLVEPLYVREPGTVEALLAKLEEEDIWPGLVIIDTLSRSFGGGEENASADMGYFVDAITALARGRMMTVLVVHHSNATGARERGNTVLRCGANAMFGCKGDINKDTQHLQGVYLLNDKQKDDAEAEEMYLRTMPVGDSLVLELGQTPEKPAKGQGKNPPKVASKADMVTLLAASENGYTWDEWRLVSRVPKSTFGRRVAQLIEAGELYKEGNRLYVMPSTKDLAALEAPDDSNVSAPSYAELAESRKRRT